MFHVRRRPADCQPRRRKKKSGGAAGAALRPGAEPALLEVAVDGAPLENARRIRLNDLIEVGSGNGMALQLYGPSIQARHCAVGTSADGSVTVTPLHADAHVYVNGQRVYHTAVLQHGCLVKFGRVSTFRFIDPSQEIKLSRNNISQSQHFDSASVYDRSPTSPVPDNVSGMMSPTAHSQMDGMDTTNTNTTNNTDYQRTMSPISTGTLSNQDTCSYNYNNKDVADNMSPYNNNTLKMENDSMMMSPHLNDSKDDLLRDDQFSQEFNNEHDHREQHNVSMKRTPNSQFKDNYETTFDLDGNVETKSICSAKSGGSGHENRLPPSNPPGSNVRGVGQEAILPAVLEFPESGQQQFLQAVISRLDVHAPAFKLAPVYTLYLCARYRASTHYRPELTPTERAHKLTTMLHHVAGLMHATVQEKYADSAAQAFWMANSSEFLHFLKCDRHISTFSTQAQDLLATTFQVAFSNLVGCLQNELSTALPGMLDAGVPSHEASTSAVLHVLTNAMALLRRCRVNAALTIQLFSHLFHYINAVAFNKLVREGIWCTRAWGHALAARLVILGAWAERQGLEVAADCHMARVHQAAHILQASKTNSEEIAAAVSACFKLNSVQVAALLGTGEERLPPPLLQMAITRAQSYADELYRADGREITLEESVSLGVGLLIPADGFSGEVVRGVPPGLADFLAPLQRAGLCRLAAQPHSQGSWTVYMNGYHGGSMTVRRPQEPVVQVIQLHKNTNGMGLSIVAAKGAGQSRLGIYIKSVVAGGAAAADGRLQAGDQLLSVDGHSLVGITQEKAAEYLVRTGPIVTLEVAKQGAVLHGLATLLQQPSPRSHTGIDDEDYDGSVHRNSGTFTNFKPTYLHRTRPESELITTSSHSAESSYALRDATRDGTSEYESYGPGYLAKKPLRSYVHKQFSLLREDSTKSSSDDSLHMSSRYKGSIPRLTFTLDCETSQLYEEQSPDTPGFSYEQEFNCQNKKVTHQIPIFTFTCEDYDDMMNQQKESQIAANENTCGMLTCNCAKTNCDINCSQEEGPNDSCDQSTNSDEISTHTCLPPQMEPLVPKFRVNSELSRSNEILHASNPKFAEDLQADDSEIPFIDDIDSEPLIFEHKSYSDGDLCETDIPVPKVRRILPSVSIDKTEEDIDKISFLNDFSEPCTRVSHMISATSDAICQTAAEPRNINVKVDHNGKFELQVDAASDDSESIEIDEIKCNGSNKFVSQDILCPSSDESECISVGNVNKIKGLILELDKMNHSLRRNNKTIFTVKDSSKEILDSKEQKSWKSPEEVRLGNGKVRALAEHFNTMNLSYHAKTYRRNCQSSPNLSNGVRKPSLLSEKLTTSASLADIKYESRLPSEQNLNVEKSEKLSEDEAKNILIQLEDWSRYGTKGSTNTLTQNSDMDESNLPSEDHNVIKENESSPALIFKEIVDRKPRIITLESIIIRSTPASFNSDNGSLDSAPKMLKKYGSLEKLTGLSAPRVVRTIPRMTFSVTSVSQVESSTEKEYKKLPDSYIVRKKKELYGTNSPPTATPIVQSCPNLLKNMSIRKNCCLVGSSSNHSCPNLTKDNIKGTLAPSYLRICKLRDNRSNIGERPPTPKHERGAKRHVHFGRSKSTRDLSPRRASERDLPGRVQAENSVGQVKPSKSVPALHEQPRQHDVFNPGYSRTSSSTSIPALTGLKSRSSHNLSTPLSPNAQHDHGFYQNVSIVRQPPHALGDRTSVLRSSQNALSGPLSTARPQSAHFSPPVAENTPRSSLSTRELHSTHNNYTENNMHQANSMYSPSTPNTNQAYNNAGQMSAQQNLRAQAKLAEMSEEVTRRQQRSDNANNLMLQNNRYDYNTEAYNKSSNGPISPATPLSPTKQQPPVAPKPQGPRRTMGNENVADDGPPLPPTNTHPHYQTTSSTLAPDDGTYIASAMDPPTLSVYPTQPQQRPSGPPAAALANPWQREEREREAEARRRSGRARRDAAIAALVALGNARTPHQQQQLRALQLERDFERRAAAARHYEKENENLAEPVAVGSSLVSSVQPVSVASSAAPTDQSQDTPPQVPPTLPPQPKSILKSNLRPDSNSGPHSPSKIKNTSFQPPETNNLPPLPPPNHSGPPNQNRDVNANQAIIPMHSQGADDHQARLSQDMANMQINKRNDCNPQQGDDQRYGEYWRQETEQHMGAPPPPERGSSFAVMSQAQALRSNLSALGLGPPRDKRVSFHDNDKQPSVPVETSEQQNAPPPLREDPDKFIAEAESMLQSPTTPTGPMVPTHTPGVIGAQEVYRDPRQKRLAEQQKAQQAGSTPIPEKLSFKEKMKMFALESGDSNTPKDKVKISRAQRDIDAVH